jgi:hypothetical protein
MVATKFLTWINENKWIEISSKKLKKKAYVNASENVIYINGSDEHFTKLIKEKGKDVDQLYDMFIIDERERLAKVNIAKLP